MPDQSIDKDLKDETEIATDPYRAIAHFFAFGIIDSTRETLQNWFEAAYARDTFWKGDFGFLVFEHDRICELIDASHILFKNKYGSSHQPDYDPARHSFPDNPLSRVKLIASRISDWNEFPYLLNCKEWEEPRLVLQDFFQYLSIQEWKSELNLWLQAGLSKESIFHITKPERILPVCLHLRKLVEAASLINIMELDGGKDMQGEEAGHEIVAKDDDEEPVRFQKPERLIDKINRSPQDGITEIFRSLQLDDICDEIYDWLQVALINDESAYETGAARWDLTDFCNELHVLAETFHVMNELSNPDSADAWKGNLPADLKEKMEKLNQPQLLTPEQLANPMKVVNRFCNRFTLAYCRAEIWDLLDAVISYEGKKEISKLNLLVVYECVSSLIEVAHVMHKKRD